MRNRNGKQTSETVTDDALALPGPVQWASAINSSKDESAKKIGAHVMLLIMSAFMEFMTAWIHTRAQFNTLPFINGRTDDKKIDIYYFEAQLMVDAVQKSTGPSHKLRIQEQKLTISACRLHLVHS